MNLPLENVKVLDMSRMLPGPYCTWLLADMGAEVLRVEQPSEIAKADKAHNIKSVDNTKRRKMRAYEIFSRNKKSILVDLKKNESKDIIYKLAESCDIFVEDYRPGAMERFGFDYQTIKKINPKIIYCSISLCGQDGPYRRRPGHDPIAMSISGLLGQILDKDGIPVITDPVPIADITAGLNAAIGILLALRVKEKDDIGQYIDISMTDTCMPLISGMFQRYFRDGALPERRGKTPYLGVWLTKDNKYLCTTDLEFQYWEAFCRAIGREDFIPLQHDKEKKQMMIDTIGKIILSRTRDEWTALLDKTGSQAASVYSIDEVLKDPQNIHRNMIIDVEDPDLGSVKQIGIPIKLSETPGKVRHTAPPPGEHTKETMESLGYSADQIDRMLKDGIIRFKYE
jgi:crotonobetainyl-CoA:carnitine CoA-transferase CaiB-like acyl-CoA transferase